MPKDIGGNLLHLKNIGPKLGRRLGEVGIRSRSDLEKIGAADAYRRLTARFADERLPLCYYLYSLQGAIEGRDWRELTPREKERLRNRAQH